MKKVPIIMATYQTEQENLKIAIDSILNQTYENIELILVCDGDHEEYERMKQIEQENKNKMKVLLNETNKGLPYSLNKAIKQSTGEYIARLDSDDICMKNRIEKQVQFLEENPEVAVCGTNAMLFGKQEGIKKNYFITQEQIKIQLLYMATLIHPTVMIRKTVLEEYPYNEEFVCSQDFELWSRIIEKYPIAIIPIVGIKYRIHDGQISIQRKQKQAELSKKVIYENSKKITGKYEEKICKTMYVLGMREKLTRQNYKEISKNIDYIIEQNHTYEPKELKKVLYNRFFTLMLMNRIIPLNINAVKKCLKGYNFKYIMEKLIRC